MTDITLPNLLPQEQEAISKVIKDISDQMTKMEATRDYIKEAKKSLVEEYDDLDLATVNALIKLYHKSNANEQFEKQDIIEALYDTLFPENNHE